MENDFNLDNQNISEKNYSKRQSNPRSTAQKILLFILIAGLGAYGLFFSIKADKNARILENQYRRTFSDMTKYVNLAENYLLKAMASGTPEMLSNMLDGVTICASSAESCLAALPIDQHSTETISEYLVQLGDIAGTWSHRAFNNENINDSESVSTNNNNDNINSNSSQLIAGKLNKDEYEMLSKLSGYAHDLSGVLTTLNENLEENSYTWTKLNKKTLNRLEKPFTDFALMTYDGKYSKPTDETVSSPDNYLSKNDCEKKAINYLAEYMNLDEQNFNIKSHNENTNKGIDTYTFDLEIKNKSNVSSATIDITKQGGQIYSLMINRAIGEKNLSAEQGIRAGLSFLQFLGYNNMKNISFSQYDDTITASYVYEQSNILCYPDEITVKIALDNGAPIALNAHKYLEAHTDMREIPNSMISAKTAEKKLSPYFEKESFREVISQTQYGDEYLAYEFTGRVSGIPMLVYIDAQTGIERDILVKNETDNESLLI